MIVALPVWHNRIAPVFDTITTLELYECFEDQSVFIKAVSMDQMSVIQKVTLLKESEIDLFICGAIPFRFEQQISFENVEVIPFVSGDVEVILEAHRLGTLQNPEFKMPGCKKERGINCRFTGE